MRELQRTMVGGQLESQGLPVDRLLNEIMGCLELGDAEDSLDPKSVYFDRKKARTLVQDFVDNCIVGKGSLG